MEFLEYLSVYVLIFVLSAIPFIESVVIIPFAIVGGMHAVPVFLIAFIGNLLTVLLVIVFVDQIRNWRKRRKDNEQKTSKRMERAQSLWKKYGLPGLAFIGPFVVGSHVTAFMSMLLGGTKRRVAIWMTASLFVWCLGFAILAVIGIDVLKIDNPFIERLFTKVKE